MGAIFSTAVPATIMRSDWRGVPRNTSAPNRERSWREPMPGITSIAQEARPDGKGQIEDGRGQLMTESTEVVRTLCPKRLSISPIRSSGPAERLALPHVHVPDDEDQDENEHLDQAEEPEPIE